MCMYVGSYSSKTLATDRYTSVLSTHEVISTQHAVYICQLTIISQTQLQHCKPSE